MTGLTHRTIQTNGIEMHLAEQGEGRPVVLCHGFPELWYSWRHQMPALAEAGYRAVAPDQRGYGGTDRPLQIPEYDIFHLTDDLLGLLDSLGEDKAVFVGHDWGAIVVWNLAIMAPERVEAVVGMSVPFLPRSPVPPTQMLSSVFGDTFFYILYFQEVGPADEELSRDVNKTMAGFLWTVSGEADRRGLGPFPRKGTGVLDVMIQPEGLPAWLSQEDLDCYVTEFTRTGFTGPLNWYRNMDRNWELTEHLAGRKVEVPALFVTGERDPVSSFMPPALMDEWVPTLRGKFFIPGAGHWVQQERPSEVNEILLDFLSGVPPAQGG